MRYELMFSNCITVEAKNLPFSNLSKEERKVLSDNLEQFKICLCNVPTKRQKSKLRSFFDSF